MIKLTSTAQLSRLDTPVPRLAQRRLAQLEGDDGAYDPPTHGWVVVLEPGDDAVRDFLEFGPMGLLTGAHDAEDVPLFETVLLHEENSQILFEAVIACDNDKTLVLLIPDHPYLNSALRQRLLQESEIAPTEEVA